MRFRAADRLDASAVGRRVTVRHRTPDGAATDVIGELVAADSTHLVVRKPAGEDVVIAREAVVAARIVRPR